MTEVKTNLIANHNKTNELALDILHGWVLWSECFVLYQPNFFHLWSNWLPHEVAIPLYLWGILDPPLNAFTRLYRDETDCEIMPPPKLRNFLKIVCAFIQEILIYNKNRLYDKTLHLPLFQNIFPVKCLKRVSPAHTYAYLCLPLVVITMLVDEEVAPLHFQILSVSPNWNLQVFVDSNLVAV